MPSIVPPPPLFSPLSGTIACLGDSITFHENGNSGNNFFKQSYGYMTWVGILTRQRWYHDLTLNFGVNGSKSSDWIGSAQLGACLAARPTICIVTGPTNDPPAGMTAAQSIANLNTIIQALSNIGTLVVLVPTTARSGGNAYTNTQQLIACQINEWMRRQAYAGRPYLIVVDLATVIDDPTSSTWTPLANMLGDGLHPTTLGAYTYASPIATALNTLTPAWMFPTANQVDSYDATNNIYGNLLGGTIGNFAGTGGSAGGGTGSIATSWTCSAAPGGATVALAKGNMADGSVSQQVTLSGTYSGSFLSCELTAGATAGNFSPGDTVEAMLDFSIAGSSQNIGCVDCRVSFTESGTTYTYRACNLNDSLQGPTVAYSGILRTQRRVIGASPSSVIFGARIWLANQASSSSVAAVVNFAKATLRKVAN